MWRSTVPTVDFSFHLHNKHHIQSCFEGRVRNPLIKITCCWICLWVFCLYRLPQISWWWNIRFNCSSNSSILESFKRKVILWCQCWDILNADFVVFWWEVVFDIKEQAGDRIGKNWDLKMWGKIWNEQLKLTRSSVN